MQGRENLLRLVLISVLCAVPDAENVHGLFEHPVHHNVRGLRNHEFARSFLDIGFTAVRVASQDLDGVVNDAAHPVGGSKVALLLDTVGNGFEVVNSEGCLANPHQERSCSSSHNRTSSSPMKSPRSVAAMPLTHGGAEFRVFLHQTQRGVLH